MQTPHGPVYTRGSSYRARAEARQRVYRAEVLEAGHGEWGHHLDDAAADAGRNFVVPEAHAAARARDAAGKGVGARTFANLLSSQAMAFNVFAPLAADLDLAARVLAPLVAGLRTVQALRFEHTPAADIFRDQSGRGGVDCDLLLDATFDEGPGVVTIETKFVEAEFSTCGFRKPGRARKGQAVCPEDVPVAHDPAACGYAAKGYRYWQRAREHATLAPLPAAGCPFGGPSWQLWVNHTLAHVEAARRDPPAPVARYLVCAPANNDALLRGGAVLDGFRATLARPDTVGLLALDAVIASIGATTGPRDPWARGITARYAGI